LAELLKENGKLMCSFQQSNPENERYEKVNNNIVDKLYELEMENEKLQKELRKSFIENTEVNEKNSHLAI
jgi:hypothetical protein